LTGNRHKEEISPIKFLEFVMVFWSLSKWWRQTNFETCWQPKYECVQNLQQATWSHQLQSWNL